MTAISWCLWDVTNDCSIGVWEDYSYAYTFMHDNVEASDVWSIIPYEETLEYILN